MRFLTIPVLGALVACAIAKSPESKPLDSPLESTLTPKPTHTLESSTKFAPESSAKDSALAPISLSPIYAIGTHEIASSTQSLQAKDALLYSGDIAKSLQYFPGFSTMRKGGLGAEVLFRSQGASRVPILLDGSSMQGACGGRMDTSATYIFPENYHRIVLIKGPQDVRFGSLISGGIAFKRDIRRFSTNTLHADTSMLAGSFNRLDLYASALAGGRYGSLQAIASHYEQGDYRTGDKSFIGAGRATHSAFQKESASLIATFTPTKYTGIELDMDIGRGFSSYQDRAMDARTFDRLSLTLKAQHEFQSSIFKLLDISASLHQVDHIMDNFSHRQPSTTYKLNNPKRTNLATRAELTLYPNENLTLYIGANYAHDDHRLRTSGDQASANLANAILQQPYTPNFAFNYAGVFVQGAYILPDSGHNVFFGVRYDYAHAQQHAKAQSALPESKSDHLGSGFVRYGRDGDLSWFVGLGVAQRSADFWERSKAGGMNLSPETNLQLDSAIMYDSENLHLQASAYGAHIWDYILLHYGATTTSALNTNALLMGAELEARYRAFSMLYISASLAYTHGQNLTTRGDLHANAPLPQVAPLQASASIWLEQRGFLLRFDLFAHAAQTRYAPNFGNVIGKDFGASAGFATLNLYGGYKVKNLSLLAGIDNITNTLYGYHLSKAGVNIGDLAPVSRIYEPGRSYFAKIALAF